MSGEEDKGQKVTEAEKRISATIVDGINGMLPMLRPVPKPRNSRSSVSLSQEITNSSQNGRQHQNGNSGRHDSNNSENGLRDGVTDWNGMENGISDRNGVLDRSEIENGISDGNENGVSDGNEKGVSDGNENGVSDGNENGVSDGNENGVSDGSENGVSDGSENGVSDGSENGVSDGNENRISDGNGMEINCHERNGIENEGSGRMGNRLSDADMDELDHRQSEVMDSHHMTTGGVAPHMENHVTSHVTSHVTNHTTGNIITSSGSVDDSHSSMSQNILNLRIRANSVDGHYPTHIRNGPTQAGLEGGTWLVGSGGLERGVPGRERRAWSCSSGSPSPSHTRNSPPMVSGTSQ